MRAGLLRQQLVLQAGTPTTDSRGGSTVSWATFGTVFGRLAPLSGTEAEVGPRLAAGVTHEGSLRNSTLTRTLTPAHRIVWSNRTFEIVSIVDVDGRPRERAFTAREVAA